MRLQIHEVCLVKGKPVVDHGSHLDDGTHKPVFPALRFAPLLARGRARYGGQDLISSLVLEGSCSATCLRISMCARVASTTSSCLPVSWSCALSCSLPSASGLRSSSSLALSARENSMVSLSSPAQVRRYHCQCSPGRDGKFASSVFEVASKKSGCSLPHRCQAVHISCAESCLCLANEGRS